MRTMGREKWREGKDQLMTQKIPHHLSTMVDMVSWPRTAADGMAHMSLSDDVIIDKSSKMKSETYRLSSLLTFCQRKALGWCSTAQMNNDLKHTAKGRGKNMSSGVLLHQTMHTSAGCLPTLVQ